VDYSSTLKTADRAPAFSLRAANDTTEHSLSEIIAAGPAVIEFLRGTW
jgi:hypothetical protein